MHTNNSVIPINDVGNKNNVIQCITDKKPCCDGRTGLWLSPSGEEVSSNAMSGSSFYLSRGGNNGTVVLNHINSATSPTGQFCCIVPDATDVNQTHCINISEEILNTVIN